MGLEVREKEKALPIMYWIPKIYKDVRDLNIINEKLMSNLLHYMTLTLYKKLHMIN